MAVYKCPFCKHQSMLGTLIKAENTIKKYNKLGLDKEMLKCVHYGCGMMGYRMLDKKEGDIIGE